MTTNREQKESLLESEKGPYDGVISPYYLMIEGNRTWKLRNKRDDSEGTVRSTLTPDEIHVVADFPGRQPTEHFIAYKYEADGLRMTMVKSVVEGQTLTWEGGLTIPTAWYLGHQESATSNEVDPVF